MFIYVNYLEIHDALFLYGVREKIKMADSWIPDAVVEFSYKDFGNWEKIN